MTNNNHIDELAFWQVPGGSRWRLRKRLKSAEYQFIASESWDWRPTNSPGFAMIS